MQNSSFFSSNFKLENSHPFGMVMPGRFYEKSGEEYRFGFQGQEKNSDLSGVDGGHLDFKYRIHDARLGRFFSIDPLSAEFPWNSPYAFSENRVIDGIELEGLEVVLLGHRVEGNIIIGGYNEFGLLIAPTGIYSYQDIGAGLATNASAATGVSITVYPAAKKPEDISGWGYDVGLAGGEGLNIAVNAAVPLGQKEGFNIFVGVGGGLSPVELQGSMGYTIINPHKDQNSYDGIMKAVGDIKNLINERIESNNSTLNGLEFDKIEAQNNINNLRYESQNSQNNYERKGFHSQIAQETKKIKNIDSKVESIQKENAQLNTVIDAIEGAGL